MVTWTDATIVRLQINGRTPLTDAQIETFISMWEQFFSTLMRYRGFVDGTKSWDATKYGILRQAATAGAALDVIKATSLSWQTLDQASLCADGCLNTIFMCSEILSDAKNVDVLRGL